MRTRRAGHHPYAADQDVPPDYTGTRPCLCGRHPQNTLHQLPDTAEAQAEHLRRIGEDDG